METEDGKSEGKKLQLSFLSLLKTHKIVNRVEFKGDVLSLYPDWIFWGKQKTDIQLPFKVPLTLKGLTQAGLTQMWFGNIWDEFGTDHQQVTRSIGWFYYPAATNSLIFLKLPLKASSLQLN